MSRLEDKSMTVYEMVKGIEAGKYVMPAFQRQFVWNMAQIEKLWDSILLGYPISTFLFWHVDSTNVSRDTFFCTFRRTITFNSQKSADDVNYDLVTLNSTRSDTAVLDGQQRLTALYATLLGDIRMRQKGTRKDSGNWLVTKLLIELDKSKIDKEEDEEDEYNSKEYDIYFTTRVYKLKPSQFELRNIMKPEFRDESTRDAAIESAVSGVPEKSRDYARELLNTLCDKIYTEKIIRYAEIIGMSNGDALEMFVRFNAGGRPLKKAEISMSILEAYWPSARRVFGEALSGSYINFRTDFIIRTAIMLYGKPQDMAETVITKSMVDNLKNHWAYFKKTLDSLDFFLAEMGIETEHFSNHWILLLPLIYYLYYNNCTVKDINALQVYLVRTAVFSFFTSATSSKLQRMRNYLDDNDRELTVNMLDQIGELRVSDERIEDILNLEQGSSVVNDALYYLSLDWRNSECAYIPAPLHPVSRFDGSQPVGIPMTDWSRWRTLRCKLPNLHLLEFQYTNNNVKFNAGWSADMSLREYYDNMTAPQQAAFREHAMIPDGVSLEFTDFEEFYNARKALMKRRLRTLLRGEDWGVNPN